MHWDWDCAQITRLVNSEAAAHHDFAEDLWKRSGWKGAMARNEQMPMPIEIKIEYMYSCMYATHSVFQYLCVVALLVSTLPRPRKTMTSIRVIPTMAFQGKYSDIYSDILPRI